MSHSRPILYYDLGSPYAYLAAERAEAALGVVPKLAPILVGGIFVERGYGSWAHTPERSIHVDEIEERARRYGLPRFRWPIGWPNNTLKAMRMAVWADRLGAGERFPRAAFRRAFAQGADLSRLDVLIDLAKALELPAKELPSAIEDPDIKNELREATDRAWTRGVVGVPCVDAGGEIFYGDDRLEQAARLVA